MARRVWGWLCVSFREGRAGLGQAGLAGEEAESGEVVGQRHVVACFREWSVKRSGSAALSFQGGGSAFPRRGVVLRSGVCFKGLVAPEQEPWRTPAKDSGFSCFLRC